MFIYKAEIEFVEINVLETEYQNKSANLSILRRLMKSERMSMHLWTLNLIDCVYCNFSVIIRHQAKLIEK